MDATTFNPADKHSEVVLSNGDLTAFNSSFYSRAVRCTVFLDCGKYYSEFVMDVIPGTRYMAYAGFANSVFNLAYSPNQDTNALGFFIDLTIGTYGAIRMTHAGTTTTIWEKPDSPMIANGDILQLAIDMDTGEVWVGLNNTWIGDPAAGTGAAKTGWDFGASLTLTAWVAYSGQWSLVPDSATQTYAAPSGFAGKWSTQHAGSLLGELGTTAETAQVREIYKEITGALGIYSEPWKWWQDLGVGNGEIDDNFLLMPTEFNGVTDAYNVTSPIAGDAGLSAVFDLIRGHWPYAADQNTILTGATAAELQYNTESTFNPIGLGCSMEALNFSEFLRANPGASKRYICVLTGLADNTTDFTLPISSFQGRFRSGSPSYLSVQVPTYKYIDDILARINGDIVVYCALLVAGVEQIREEIARASLDDPRSDRGGRSQTVTLSGHSTGTFGSESVILQGVQETGEANGKKKIVASVDLYLRPGNTAVVPGFGSFTVGLVSYSISSRGEKMEVTEA